MFKPLRSKWWVLLAGVTALALLGSAAAGLRARQLDAEMRDGLQRQMTGLSRAISPELAATLSFTSADADLPAYHQLREQLTAFGRMIPNRGLYTIARRGDRFVFGPENYPAMDPLASAPGTAYESPPPAVQQVFTSRLPQTMGPYTDEFGTFVSALAPVLDPHSGDVIMVVGLDMLADSWSSTVGAARRDPWLWVGATALLAGLGTLLIDRRERGAWAARRWAWHLDAIVVGALGLALTSEAALWTREMESRERRETFARLAESQAEGVRRSLQVIQRDQVLLSTFFESSQTVEGSEFAHFSAPLTRFSPARATYWVPAVPAGAGPSLPDPDPLAAAYIWERDAQGRPQPASARPWYYPVQFHNGNDGYELAVGFDLGSESVTRAAIEKIRRTGLPTATDLVASIADPQGPRVVETFMPVLGADPGDGSGPVLRGFVTNVLQCQEVLEQALVGVLARRDELRTELLDLDGLDPTRPLAVTPAGTAAASLAAPAKYKGAAAIEDQQQGLHSIHPVFAYDRAYAVRISPTDAFLARHSLRLAALVAGVGLSLTVLLVIFVTFLRGRQLETERQVRERTADLLESNRRLEAATLRAHELAVSAEPAGAARSELLAT